MSSCECDTSVGKLDLICISNRLQQLAAVLAAHQLHRAAAHCEEARGAVLGKLAARAIEQRERREETA